MSFRAVSLSPVISGFGLLAPVLDLLPAFFGQFAVPCKLGDDLFGLSNQLVLELAHFTSLSLG